MVAEQTGVKVPQLGMCQQASLQASFMYACPSVESAHVAWAMQGQD
jgi:hypothetical protein